MGPAKVLEGTISVMVGSLKASKVIWQPCVSGGYDFLSLDHLDFRWQIAVNGVIVETGKLEGFSLVPKGIWILRPFHLTNPRFHVFQRLSIDRHQCSSSWCTNSSSAYKAFLLAGLLGAYASSYLTYGTEMRRKSARFICTDSRVILLECVVSLCVHTCRRIIQNAFGVYTVQYVWVHELISRSPGRTGPAARGGGSRKRVQSVDVCCIAIFGAYFLIHT